KDVPSGKRLSVTAIFAGVLSAAGLLALPLHPFSKHLLSLSYILLTTGVSSALLALLILLRELWGVKVPIVGLMGRNPLVLYMLHAVIGVVALAILGDAISAGLAWAVSFLVLGICVLVAALMDRARLYVKL